MDFYGWFIYLQFVAFIAEKLSGSSPETSPEKMETGGIVLVAGATGGVGRRVVDILRKKGLRVRALVNFVLLLYESPFMTLDMLNFLTWYPF